MSALRGQISLRDPGPLVKQSRRRIERLDIDLDDLGADFGNLRQRRFVSRFRNAIPEEQTLAGQRHAEPQAFSASDHGAQPAERAGTGSAASGTGDHLSIAMASSTVSANTETQSSVRQAGTTPAVRNKAAARLRARRCC